MKEKAYFIKLGGGGRTIDIGNNEQISFAKYCIDNRFAYFGFGSDGFFEELLARNYDNFYNYHMAGRTGTSTGVATRVRSAAKIFIESADDTYWFTFHDGDFYWAQLEGEIEKNNHTDGIWRRVKGQWSNRAIGHQKDLKRTTIPGSVAKIAGYRGTICSAGDATQSAINVIQGTISPGAVKAQNALPEFHDGLLAAIHELRDKDFEVLVDLIVSNRGWQRIGSIGGVEKFTDGEYKIPVIDFDVSVQTKTMTSLFEFREYISESMTTVNGDSFFLYIFNNSNDIDAIYEESKKHRNVRVIGPRELPQLALSAGLFNWVIDHAR